MKTRFAARRTFGQWLTTSNHQRGIGYGASWDMMSGLLKIATVLFIVICMVLPAVAVAVRLIAQ